MMYSPNTYANLLQVITDKSYAKSKYLIVKKVIQPTHEQYLIKYDKQFLNHDNIKELGLFRSVIVESTGKIVSFSPPKSVDFDHMLNVSKSENIESTEFCEGTMISLFWDKGKSDWELATKGNIGARCKFFQENPKTFRSLFLEILNDKNIELDSFNKNNIYSFVIQHPDNRIVVPFEKMDMKLVQIYNITDSNDVMGCKNMQEVKDRINEIGINIETPRFLNKVLDTDEISVGEMKHQFKTLNLPWNIVGGIFIDTATGMRTKIRNPSYEYVKQLKGNNPKIQFQYYSLRQANKVSEYLKFYPEKKIEFAKLRNQLHNWSANLYKNYISCYIKKENPLRNFPYEFKHHMFELHRLYLEKLRPMNSYVSKSVVIDYINNLHPARLMFVINYKVRQNIIKNNKDDIKLKQQEAVK